MKIKIFKGARSKLRQAAFSLVEATIGMGIVGTTIAGLFGGFTSGFFTMRMARENLRATQILLEKVETIRLYSWDQVTSPTYIPASFTAQYDPEVATQTPMFTGTIVISDGGVAANYGPDMKKVTVTLNWKTGKLNRSRQFTSYISRFGMQDYVY
jgi:type II secretory pathway pseudopilin PulG